LFLQDRFELILMRSWSKKTAKVSDDPFATRRNKAAHCALDTEPKQVFKK